MTELPPLATPLQVWLGVAQDSNRIHSSAPELCGVTRRTMGTLLSQKSDPLPEWIKFTSCSHG